MPRGLPGYDLWKTSNPDEEEDGPKCRQPTRLPDREFESKVVNGVRIYEADFFYDPLGRD